MPYAPVEMGDALSLFRKENVVNLFSWVLLESTDDGKLLLVSPMIRPTLNV
jgi:hypothetical protein